VWEVSGVGPLHATSHYLFSLRSRARFGMTRLPTLDGTGLTCVVDQQDDT
jgi:hypothetical protein